MRHKHHGYFSILQMVYPIKALFHRLSLYILLIAAIVILGLSQIESPLIERIRTSVTDIVTPIMTALIHPIEAYKKAKLVFQEQAFVYEENLMLKQENIRLKRIEAVAIEMEAENKRLRELLHLLPEPPVTYTTVRVISDTGGPFRRHALISHGMTSGIIKGQIVVNEKGLVGRVLEAGNRSARILLVTDINSRIPVITKESRERAILAGNNTALLDLLRLPTDTQVQPNELIVTSGDGEFFPSGIPIGVIESISNNAPVVKPLVDLSRLEYVRIVHTSP